MKDHFLPPPCQKRACDCLHSSTEPQTTTPPPLSEPQQPDPVCMTVTGVSGQPHRLVAVSVNAAPSIKPPLETSTHARAHTHAGTITYSGWLSMIPVCFRGWKLGPAACTIPSPRCRLRWLWIQAWLTAAIGPHATTARLPQTLRAAAVTLSTDTLLLGAAAVPSRLLLLSAQNAQEISLRWVQQAGSWQPSRRSFLLGRVCVWEADEREYLLFSNSWLTNKDMSAKTVLWAAKASPKKALSPSSGGRLTDRRSRPQLRPLLTSLLPWLETTK